MMDEIVQVRMWAVGQAMALVPHDAVLTLPPQQIANAIGQMATGFAKFALTGEVENG